MLKHSTEDSVYIARENSVMPKKKATENGVIW